jgi:hypothetical protein
MRIPTEGHRFPMLKYELITAQLLFEETITEEKYFHPTMQQEKQFGHA